MAKIGLSNFRYGILTEGADGTPSYGGAKTPGKAVSCNVNVTNNTAELYADNALAESDYGFQKATVTMGIDRNDDTVMADLLGHTIASDVMTRNAQDVAPYVGLGHIVTEMVDGTYKYRAEFLFKVKFSENSKESSTRGESLEFSTIELEGTATTLKNGDWSCTETFTTHDAALAYIEGLLAAPTPAPTENANPQ